MKVGDTIQITDKFLVRYLTRKGLSSTAILLEIDGGYHYVRPLNAEADCIFELYDNEIGEIKK
jgi:hypothetical protein